MPTTLSHKNKTNNMTPWLTKEIINPNWPDKSSRDLLKTNIKNNNVTWVKRIRPKDQKPETEDHK